MDTSGQYKPHTFRNLSAAEIFISYKDDYYFYTNFCVTNRTKMPV
ncbi:hypothetical Protein YC6258_05445 [Gynuella sunshinyii YC6258]|uniref:Uncharacterized protein n=1 Tax=Gynuella sunshinyii YC6258 TaxID=1445510 RepID=A0A0C5VDS3_9GAMM|nr:hypothetical Protein YC6258_05445 [Gynuella sunshinyii YC6258]